MPEPVLPTRDVPMTKTDLLGPCTLVSYSLMGETDNEQGVRDGF